MDNEIAGKLRCLSGYVVKPGTWAALDKPIPREWLDGLRRFTSKELGIDQCIYCRLPPWVAVNLFLVEHEGGLYLVNTEGFQMARRVRYVGQIVGPRKIPVAPATPKGFAVSQDTTDYVRKALENNGYSFTAQEMLAAVFKGHNDRGVEIHELTYNNEGERDRCNIYVEEKDGRKVAEF